MPTNKDNQKAIDLLAASIRLQKSRRDKHGAKSRRSISLLQEMESDMEGVLDWQELSRQKLARYLHDGLTQTVASLAMRVNFTRRQMDIDPEAAKQELLKVEELTRQTAKDIRHMIFILRRVNIESQGLIAVLERMVDKMRELFDLEICLSIDPDLVESVPPYKQKILYSVIEQGIDNARRYAEAKHVWVRLNDSGGEMMLLEIEDDGETETQKEEVSRDQQLESLWEYARLVSGIVKAESVEGKGRCIQILIPNNALNTQGRIPGQ